MKGAYPSKSFQKSLMVRILQTTGRILTIGVENKRLIIDCLYLLCKRGATF